MPKVSLPDLSHEGWGRVLAASTALFLPDMGSSNEASVSIFCLSDISTVQYSLYQSAGLLVSAVLI